MTPDINCEADVKYPSKRQKGLCDFYEGKSLKVARVIVAGCYSISWHQLKGGASSCYTLNLTPKKLSF